MKLLKSLPRRGMVSSPAITNQNTKESFEAVRVSATALSSARGAPVRGEMEKTVSLTGSACGLERAAIRKKELEQIALGGTRNDTPRRGAGSRLVAAPGSEDKARRQAAEPLPGIHK